MRRYRAALSGPGTFFAGQCWADWIINMSGFDLRLAQPRRRRRVTALVRYFRSGPVRYSVTSRVAA
jgi:hypothetical protein